MIDELLSLIKTQVHANNTYFNKFSVNCFQDDNGNIVADFNRQEAYEGATDVYGVGAYVRYTGNIQYSEPKKITSCNMAAEAVVPLRLVAYHFDDSKEFNIARLEEKLSNDLMSVSFAAHTGQETKIELVLVDSDLNSHDNWKREMGRPMAEGNNFFQMVAINFNLKFVRTQMKQDCFDDCFVFNNDTKC